MQERKQEQEQVNMQALYTCATILWSFWGPFLSLEAAILWASTKVLDHWPVPIFSVCAREKRGREREQIRFVRFEN